MKHVLGLSILTALACWAGVASATPPNTSEVPNGAESNCLTCHARSTGGQPLNHFGRDFDAEASWTRVLCEQDSDGDGYTNGEELGDPLCGWRQGPAARSNDITNPGDSTSAPQIACGNLIVQDGEECDGFNLDGKFCPDVGDFTGGNLDCQACRFSTAGCTDTPDPSCGDGHVDAGEACDGEELAGLACEDVGDFEGGVLRCDEACAFDTTGCSPFAPDMPEDISDMDDAVDMAPADEEMGAGGGMEVEVMEPDPVIVGDMANDMGVATGMEPESVGGGGGGEPTCAHGGGGRVPSPLALFLAMTWLFLRRPRVVRAWRGDR